MSPHGLSAYRAALLDRPSVTGSGRCAFCGARATNEHHVIPKGMGGMGRALERRVPRIEVCGMGNAGGCHGKLHAGLLHVYWDGSRGGWVAYEGDRPMKDAECWAAHGEDYVALPGWAGRSGGLE